MYIYIYIYPWQTPRTWIPGTSSAGHHTCRCLQLGVVVSTLAPHASGPGSIPVAGGQKERLISLLLVARIPRKVEVPSKRLYDQRAVRLLFALGDWVMRYYPAGKKCKLDSIWAGPYLIVATLGWTVGIQRHPDEPVTFIHCQDVKKIPPPGGMQ